MLNAAPTVEAMYSSMALLLTPTLPCHWEISIDAPQLGICRLDNVYEMKWRSRPYVFAITQVQGVLYVDGKTFWFLGLPTFCKMSLKYAACASAFWRLCS